MVSQRIANPPNLLGCLGSSPNSSGELGSLWLEQQAQPPSLIKRIKSCSLERALVKMATYLTTFDLRVNALVSIKSV